MVEVWIVEEKVTNKFLDESGHHIRIDGELDTAFFIGADGEGYAERNKNYLLDYLLCQNKFPFYITFMVDDGQTDEYIEFFNENRMEYSLKILEEKRTYYNYSGKHQYNPPCFTVKINDSNSLVLLLNETYWLPTQNEFYSISFSDNLKFELREVKEWGRKRKRSIPIFKIEQETTFITIFPDGHGFYLFSNDNKYNSLNKIIKTLPKGTVITQINDTLVNIENVKEE
ncbi:hypothetical protein [Niallia sp. FSL R7-0271]|uniref:hypothetical protein n=1 Tax=Niallia sp. FSL R7-0271 TaxID=2921678 RepID=UPI0030FBC70D